MIQFLKCKIALKFNMLGCVTCLKTQAPHVNCGSCIPEDCLALMKTRLVNTGNYGYIMASFSWPVLCIFHINRTYIHAYMFPALHI